MSTYFGKMTNFHNMHYAVIQTNWFLQVLMMNDNARWSKLCLGSFHFSADPDPGFAIEKMVQLDPNPDPGPGSEHLFKIYWFFLTKKGIWFIFLTFSTYFVFATFLTISLRTFMIISLRTFLIISKNIFDHFL